MTEHEILNQPTLLLGCDHLRYGEVELLRLAEGRSACAISVGSDPQSPALANKGDPDCPNEDALLAVDRGERALLAVADAHFGWEASHAVLRALASVLEDIPTELDELASRVSSLEIPEDTAGSSTTLLVAVHDRRSHSGFGLSLGDSSLALVGPHGARTVSPRSDRFIDPRHPPSLQVHEEDRFEFLTASDQLVLAFTDGIDECHYRSPRTSIGSRQLATLYTQIGPVPDRYARRLMQMALAGVGGHPGGQDNIALIVSSARRR